MRNKTRIKRILGKIEELWNRSPDQRLGQLLINLSIIPDDNYTWHIEDDELEAFLDRILEEKE